MTELTCVAMTVPGLPDAAIPFAAARAGAIGILDVSWPCEERAAIDAARTLARTAGRNWGIKFRPGALADRLFAELAGSIPYVIVEGDAGATVAALAALTDRGTRIVVDVISVEEAESAAAMKPFALIAKGRESGGRIGDESSFILLQRLHGAPVWVHGGIGSHSVAAACCGGASAVVLDGQLWLARESPISERMRRTIARMDGSESVCVGGAGQSWRIFSPSTAAIHELKGRLAACQQQHADATHRPPLRDVVDQCVSWSPDREVLPLGQDVAFAGPLADQEGSVGRIIASIRHAAADAIRRASSTLPLGPHSPLARSHGTVYPIVQGPMTRVSDRASFAERVAAEGALPFLALALMGEDAIGALLEQTRSLLGARPFGVGILGFVPLDIREAQLRVVRAHRPAFALIAGGRPDQAEMLESEGIPTYLHVPSPSLLEAFLDAGARRFVFEGSECGGHVGPRSSLVLWDQMTRVLLRWAESHSAEASDVHVLFAGGIHDARSSAMVASLAAPLADRGVRLGVLLGTAYLFTEEAVATGAVVRGFQEEAIRCTRTSLLETAVGHAIRCASTPFSAAFEETRRQLQDRGVPADERRETLERLNLGRLRLAAKGLVRGSDQSAVVGALRHVPDADQHVEGLYMMGEVAAVRDRTCTMAALHADVSVGGCRWLQRLAVPASEPSCGATAPSEIAIIGIGCMFPKAPSADRFWTNILTKVDAIQEIPAGRWNWRDYFDSDPSARDKVYSRWGGFLDEMLFDPVQYAMPPTSIASIEPMQLLALETVRAALADAGYARHGFPRDRTAVVLGVSGGASDLGHRYIVRSAIPGMPASCRAALDGLPEWTEDSFPGVLPNVVAGRISNRFNLGGANYTVDAACASSLAALHMAVAELESGACDLVIAGGADTQQNPFTFLAFSKTHALSPQGRCRPFAADADGIAVSEGLAMVVLKRLRDAERDGDRIYAVVKGVGAASDGKERALTAPGHDGQVRALERAYARAGISPATVAYVEAHGTGTVVGDHAELESLTHVYRAAGATPRAVAIGSVKSMIGHTKATAGMAGLVKTALALYHRVLPPTIGVDKPNTLALPSDGAFYVNTALRPWMASPADTPRRAAVSAFGFGGTNFHAVLEEYGSGVDRGPGVLRAEWPSELLVFTGSSTHEVVRVLGSLRDQLDAGAHPALSDLACALWRAAERPMPPQPVRMTMVVYTLDDLRAKLDRGIERLTSPPPTPSRDIYYFENPLGSSGRTAFLFPGQGSQYPDMLIDLAVHFREAREAFERADRVLGGRLPRALTTYVFPPPRFGDDDEELARAALTATQVAQPALGAAAMAAAHLLRSLQIHPDMVAGHSYGEYPALCWAGVFSEDDLYDVSETRGRLMIESGVPGGAMAAIEGPRELVERIIGAQPSVWIANLNAPTQTVIAGTTAAIAQAIAQLESAGAIARPIPVSCAFHSPMMGAVRERLADRLRAIALSAPKIAVFANASADLYPPDTSLLLEQLSDHLVASVDFEREVGAMYDAGARVFVEVGPRNLLSRFVDRILGDRPHVAIPLDVEGRPGLLQLQHALAQLAAHHVPIALDRIYDGRSAVVLDLATLVEMTRPSPPPATAWRVDGGRAWPVAADETARPVARPPVQSAAPRSPVVAPAAAAVPPRDRDAPPSGPLQFPRASVSHTPAGSDDRALTLQGFHALMTQILDTQRAVMLAYLRGPRDVDTMPPPPVTIAADLDSDRVRQGTEAIVDVADPTAGAERVAVTPDPVAARRPVGDVLMGIVSKRTGYPVEILRPDADVESELGIDSLKIAEILAAFQQTCQKDDAAHVKAMMEKLTKAKTLGAMIATLEAAMNNGHSDAPPSGAIDSRPAATVRHRVTADGATLARFTLELTPSAIDRGIPPAGTTVVLTDDEGGIARAVADRLAEYGCEIVMLRDTVGASDGDNDADRTDLADPTAIGAVLSAHRRRSGSLSGLLHLLPLKRRGPLVPGRPWPDDLKRQATIAFLLAKELSQDVDESGAHALRTFTVATFGDASDRHDAESPTQCAALAGLVKTAATEWRAVRCRYIEVDASETAARIAPLLIDEMYATDGLVDVRYRDGRRMTPRPIEARRRLRPPHVTLDRDSVVLVTGGSRGITAAVAQHLAARDHPTLHITSRVDPPDTLEPAPTASCETLEQVRAALRSANGAGGDRTAASINAEAVRIMRQREYRQTIRAIRATGAVAHYHRVDVRDEAAFARLLDAIYRRHGRLDGVIHGAGLIEDALIANKSLDSFERVFDTKVAGAAVLSRALDVGSVQFVVFFSSIAACFGSRGQVDYAAANDALNTIAADLDRRWPARVLSIAWGPWAEIGMVSPAVADMMRQRGVTLIQPSEGVRAFDWELRYADKHVGPIVLGHGPWADERIVDQPEVEAAHAPIRSHALQ